MGDRMRDRIDPATAPSAARAAAVWWANQLAAPRFDNGDTGQPGAFGTPLGHTAANRNPVTDAQLAEFTDELERRIGDTERRILDVDYGPGPMLAEAADAAGISLSRFPWKTNMWIHAEYVTVSAGYGARDRLVWSAPHWQRPVCRSHRHDRYAPPGSRFLDGLCGRLRYHDDDCGDWFPDPERCAVCSGTYAECHNAWEVGGPGFVQHGWQPEPTDRKEPE